MYSSSISLLSPSSPAATGAKKTEKPKNITNEVAQNQLNGLSVTERSDGLIDTKQFKWFKDHSLQLPYNLFYKALQGILGSHRSETNHTFVSPLLTLIAEYVDDITSLPTPSISSSVSQRREFVSSIGFGKKMWNDYFGDIGTAPPLPPDICAILKRACPFFPGKTVEQTHMLVLVPETLNGTPLTLKRLGELLVSLDLKQGKTGFDVVYYHRRNHDETPFEKSHWVLMTNEVVHETREKSYVDQIEIIERHANYQVPKLAQAVVAIFMEYLATGIYHYGLDTYARCQEKGLYGQMLVGGYNRQGLLVAKTIDNSDNKYGVAALRKFI